MTTAPEKAAPDPASGAAPPVVELRGVSKSFGQMRALTDVSLDLRAGEIVSLVGDNGAGKSTLTKVITGVYAPDEGQVLIDGQQIRGWNTRRARERGIETVFQDQALAPQQTIAENLFMGREPKNRLGFIRAHRMRTEADRLMRDLGFTSDVFSARSRVSNLSGGERQGVAIARAVYFQARLIIMDEPTTALSLTEVDEVLEFIRRVRSEGRGVLFISHNIHHSHQVADRIVVLDRGCILRVVDRNELSVQELITYMQDANSRSRRRSAS